MLLMGTFLFSGASAQDKINMQKDLNYKQKSLAIVSSLTAKDDLLALKPYLRTALDSGVTVNEIKEAMVHLYAYCGFPRSLRGLQTMMAVLDERKAKGIKDNWGRAASRSGIPALSTNAEKLCWAN